MARVGVQQLVLLGCQPRVEVDDALDPRHAWVGGLFECVHGRETFAELETNLVRTCRLLVDPLLS